jgi:hypothetical protein
MMLSHDSLLIQHFPEMVNPALGQGSRETLMVQSMTGSVMIPSSPRDAAQPQKKALKKVTG